MSDGFKGLAKIPSPTVPSPLKKLGGLKSTLKAPSVKKPVVVKSYVRNS